MTPTARKKMIADEVCKAVLEEHKITKQELIGWSRLGHLVKARRDFCVRGHKAGLSTTYMGKFLGHVDHTTARYHLEKAGLTTKRQKPFEISLGGGIAA